MPLFSIKYELADIFPGQGPLAGLHAALSAGYDSVFMAAVDLPFASGEAAAEVLRMLGGHDACVIRRGEKFEPAFAAYGRNCLPVIEKMLEKGDNKVGIILRQVNTRWLSEADLTGFDIEKILSNENHPEDFEKIKSPV